MPEIEHIQNTRQMTSDRTMGQIAPKIIDVLGKMGLLGAGEVRDAHNMSGVNAANKYVSKIHDMAPEMRQKFARIFVDMSDDLYDVPTDVLADAYVDAHNRQDGARLARLKEHIDERIENFEYSSGLFWRIKDGRSLRINTANIADEYEGFTNMLHVRAEDFDPKKDADKRSKFDRLTEYANEMMKISDKEWGLDKAQPDIIKKLEDRCQDLQEATARSRVHGRAMDQASKYKFKDADNKILPQFIDEDGNLHEDWIEGCNVARGGRLDTIIDTLRNEIVMQNLTSTATKIDEDALEELLNQKLPEKLYAIMASSRTGTDVLEPAARTESFTEEQGQKFIDALANAGGEISDAAYNDAIDEHVNATGGFMMRLRSKLSATAEQIEGLCDKVYHGTDRFDKLSKTRMAQSIVDKRRRRREFAKRIVKGMGSTYLAKILIGGATATVSSALGLSMGGVGLGVSGIFTGVQIKRWRDAQIAAGKPTTFKEFLKNKRLVTAVGVSLLGAAAIALGAVGAPVAAGAVGMVALGAGGLKNAIEIGRDAKRDLGRGEAVLWGLGSLGTTLISILLGQATLNFGIDQINTHFHDNNIAQTHGTKPEPTTKEVSVEVTNTRDVYTELGLEKAKEIAMAWNSDNPDRLAQRVDAVIAYNEAHGTNIDPYRAIMLSADAGGRTLNGDYHHIMTQYWQDTYHVPDDTVNAAAHVFTSDDGVTDEGMQALIKLDGMVGERNTIGKLPNVAERAESGIRTPYSDVEPAIVPEEYQDTIKMILPDVKQVPDTNPVVADEKLTATFGNYNPEQNGHRTLRRRFGILPSAEPGMAPQVRVLEEEPVDKEKSQEIQPEAKKQYVAPEASIIKLEEPEQVAESNETDAPEQDVEVAIGDVPPVSEEHESEQQKDIEFVAPDLSQTGAENDSAEEAKQTFVQEAHEPTLMIADSTVKSWKDAKLQLSKLEREISKNPNYKDLRKMLKQKVALKNKINHLRNVMGRPSDTEIKLAVKEYDRRKEIRDLMAEREMLKANPPVMSDYVSEGDGDTTDWERIVAEYNKTLADIDEKIANAGGEESLILENLDYLKPGYEPVHGVQRQKKDERAIELAKKHAAEAEAAKLRQKELEKEAKIRDLKNEDRRRGIERLDIKSVLKRCSEKMNRVKDKAKEYFTPESIKNLAKNPQLLSEPITNIRGVDVKLVDLSRYLKNPLVQYQGRPMVVVDVAGLKIPFYMANGQEGFLQVPTGDWHVMLHLVRDGRFLLGKEDEEMLAYYGSKELQQISEALNKRFGNLCNWRDKEATQLRKKIGGEGDVGGSDALPKADTSQIFDIVHKIADNVKWVYGGATARKADDSIGANPKQLAGYLADVKSNDWEPEEETFMDRVGDFADRAKSFFAGRLFRKQGEGK